MKFEIEKIKNFAVIKENKDKIFLNDLTIFMGDNSAGKSYLAILFNLLINLEEELNLDINDLQSKKMFSEIIDILGKIKIDSEITLNFEKNEILELKDVLEIVIKSFIKKHFKKLITRYFDLKINYYYEFNEINCIIKKSQSDSLFEFTIEFKEKNSGIESKLLIEKSDFNEKILLKKIFETFFVFLVKSSFNIPLSVYLPAARTGYLHTYPILGEYAIKKSFSFREKDMNEIELPEWLKRFILNLFIPSNNVNDNEIATIIEEDILEGKVKVYKKESKIEFYKGKKKIDISYTSSSISELIPLVVFLKKGLIKKGNLLIIEEPEAHLSFENQRKIARIIALLVNNGIKVLITTHSDFLIYEINNLIIANSVSEEKRPSVYKNLSLDYKKVNVYNFLLKGKKSIIEKVEVKKDGIDNKYITENILNRINAMEKLYDLMEN